MLSLGTTHKFRLTKSAGLDHGFICALFTAWSMPRCLVFILGKTRGWFGCFALGTNLEGVRHFYRVVNFFKSHVAT